MSTLPIPQILDLYAFRTDYFSIMYSFSRDFRLEFWVSTQGCEPPIYRGITGRAYEVGNGTARKSVRVGEFLHV